jgi:anti-sigma-K factor RskA
VLQKDAASPAFLVEVNLRSLVLTVRPVAAERQPGKSYELWMIQEKLGAPKSLGVIADRGFTVRPTLAAYEPAVIEDALFAVTLEPEGGSPTGAPTSAPLWTGKLVQATP